MNDLKISFDNPKKVVIKNKQYASHDLVHNINSPQNYPVINTHDHNSSKWLFLLVDDNITNKFINSKKQESTKTFSEIFKPRKIRAINISKEKNIKDDSMILNLIPRNPLYYPKIKALNDVKHSRNNDHRRYGSDYF